MCDFIVTPLMTAFAGAGAGAATAAGATAGATAAAGTATALTQLGTIVSIAGTGLTALNTAAESRRMRREIEVQKATEAKLTAVEDQRTRRSFVSEIRRQAAELLARGVSLDSPTAVALGDTAARELSYESQAVRSGGEARQIELTSEQRSLRAKGRMALLKGGFSAAGTLLEDAPDLWPGLLG